ncbi:hypothetical protein ACFXPX_01515 [Kitasatospora sp. NPDC059146]|uniref:hypothetical protein n=1 Tax=unclassified Kitasatospora TaxID=2633591 RepID=UPI00367BF6B0
MDNSAAQTSPHASHHRPPDGSPHGSRDGSPHEPLPGRVGHVAGIESLTLDGRRHYFAFDHRSDLVVSPLVDDPDAMAAFAAAHLRQSDGPHDRAYWAALVADAAEASALVDDDAEREFRTGALRTELPEPGGHLLYLLDAATDLDPATDLPAGLARACERLGHAAPDDDDFADTVDDCLETVATHGPSHHPDEWTVARGYLTAAIAALPGNWGLLFTPVAEGLAARTS